MKMLLIYYSRTGNTKKVAEFLKNKINCDAEEIVSIKNRSGIIGYLISGREAMFKKPAQIQSTIKNPADYDLVVIGTPVWAGNVSSPIRAYLLQNAGKLKKIALFCTMGGRGADKAFSNIEEILNLKSNVKLALLTKEVQDGEYEEKIDKFISELG